MAGELIAFCVKCGKKSTMEEPELLEAKGRFRYSGKCGKCGTKMSLFVSADKAKAAKAKAK